MSTESRSLKAIMFTDVVGYSALMAEDESRAMSVLARQRALLPPLIASHGGTLHKEIGDGTLSTFASAVDALKCAQALQGSLSPETFQLRIGLHLGEVIVQDGDVFGDGVNTASRLEALAEPRGIVMSADFHRAVRNQASVTARSLGAKLGGVRSRRCQMPLAPSGGAVSLPQHKRELVCCVFIQ